jgi:hypothetical protein
MMQVVANQKFIETRRKTVSFSVSDTQNIQIWEAQVIRKRWTRRKLFLETVKFLILVFPSGSSILIESGSGILKIIKTGYNFEKKKIPYTFTL